MVASDLARPLPPPLGAAVAVRRALEVTARRAGERVAVRSRGRIVGLLRRDELVRAADLGFADLPLAAFLLEEAPRVAGEASLLAVRRELVRPGRSFVLVGPTDRGVRAWISDADVPPRARRGPALVIARRRLRESIDARALEALERVAREAAALGTAAFLVGGPVRDLLLGRRAIDLDVVIDGDVRALAGRLGGSVRAHGPFLTATITFPDGLRLDLVRARSERYPRRAALPEVRPAGLDEDLARRDFTVNAMAARLSEKGDLPLVDPFGGRGDLRRKRIRVLHALSFLEDPTRAFRAIRLAQRLGFQIEPGTQALLRTAVRHGLVAELSAARLRRELAANLVERPASAAVGWLARLGTWKAVAPGIPLPPGSRARVATLETWLDRHPELVAAPRFGLVLAALTTEGSPAALDTLIERLLPPRAVASLLREAAVAAAELAARLAPEQARARPSRIHALCRRHGPAALVVALAATHGPVRRAIARYLLELRHVRPALGARDLLDAGVPPGPAIGRGLRAALRARLDGRAPDGPRQLRIALRAARARA